MKKLKYPFLAGALAGGMLTTVMYVAVSSFVSLSWSAQPPPHRSRKVQEVMGDEVLPGIEELGPDLMPEIVLATPPENLVEFEVGNDSEDQVTPSISEQHLWRGMLLSVVASSGDGGDMYEKVGTTWGGGGKDWKLVFGSRKDRQISPETILELTCGDFPSSGNYMSPRQLICFIEGVFKHFHAQYRWFLFAPDSAYVSVSHLHQLLSHFDPDNGIAYLGLPHSDHGHCIGDSGFVLSQHTLNAVVPLLDSCLESVGPEVTTGDVFLGNCIRDKLRGTCLPLGESEGYFVRDFHRTSLSPFASDWLKTHPYFATVTPVTSYRDFRLLHTLDLIREHDHHVKMATDLSRDLYEGPICSPKSSVVDVTPPKLSSELKGWNVANPNSTYFSNRLDPREWYDGELRLEIDMLGRQVLYDMNQRNSTNFGFWRVVYGFFRSLGTDGRELILDVETTAKEIKHFHVHRPLVLDPVVLEDAGEEAIGKMIDFVVPISNVRSRFAEFMKTYENVCLAVNENCRLNVVVYGEDDLNILKSNLSHYKARYPHAQFNLIPGQGRFSRGRALHTGISTLHKSDLAFTCDVDMTIERSFLNRCRRNAIQGRRAYYPEVFKYYDMDYVYRFEKKPLFGYDISRKHGHWCTYGYGMVCMYKSDYDYVGGYDVNIEGWGGEDIQLVDNVIKFGYEVMRAPDPALSHRHHSKVCGNSLSKSQLEQCISSRNEDIADRRRLADYIFYLENKCNVKKKIWD